jgi:DNA-binding MarR family transcriptional regulator/CBS domain-containing protein
MIDSVQGVSPERRCREVSAAGYRQLAEFRYRIRQFLHLSEEAARSKGIEPQQHQVLLAIKGLPGGSRPTVRTLSERLCLRHHSTVELIDRLVEQRAIARRHSVQDRREMLIELTPHGEELLMMGAALGGIESLFLPHFGVGFWPLVSMGAILGGTMRSPFAGIIFAIELTHDLNMLLPLLVACFLAHTFTVLTLKRSILTEKISRRGYHLSREYGLDPLEILFVREVMRTNIVALPCDGTLQEAQELVHHDRRPRGQYLFPVVDSERELRGVVTRKQLLTSFEERRGHEQSTRISDIASTEPLVAFADEPLIVVVRRMAESGLTRFPVLDPLDRRLVGMISLNDLLGARIQNLEDERARERVLRIRMPSGRQARTPTTP